MTARFAGAMAIATVDGDVDADGGGGQVWRS